MGINLWRRILETASDEELKHVLHETGIPISGFRADKTGTVPRSLIIRTMVQVKNGKKIRGVYQKLLENDLWKNLEIEDALRKKIIELILVGEPECIIEAECLSSQLITQVEQGKNSQVKETIKSSSEQNVIQEWQKKYIKLERETKKKLQNLEQKYETKVKEGSELKRKILILEKRHEGEISRIREQFTEVVEESNLYQKQIEELQKKTMILENQIRIKDEEVKDLTQEIQSHKAKNEECCQEIEKLLGNKVKDENPSNDINIQEESEYTNCSDNKIKVIVIGETFHKQEKLKTFDVEFIHAQEINEEELEKRSNSAINVILLSWTMNITMQRKIKKKIPKEKLKEFDDYNTFRKYINDKERMNYGSK